MNNFIFLSSSDNPTLAFVVSIFLYIIVLVDFFNNKYRTKFYWLNMIWMGFALFVNGIILCILFVTPEISPYSDISSIWLLCTSWFWITFLFWANNVFFGKKWRGK